MRKFLCAVALVLLMSSSGMANGHEGVKRLPLESYMVKTTPAQRANMKPIRVVGRNKDTEPWRVSDLVDQAKSSSAKARIDKRIKMSSDTYNSARATHKLAPPQVMDAFWHDVRHFGQPEGNQYLALQEAAVGEPMGNQQAGGLKGKPSVMENVYMGISGVTTLVSVYEYEGEIWIIKLQLACGNVSHVLSDKVGKKLPPPELITPPEVKPPTSVPETVPEHVTSEMEIIGGFEFANLPDANGSTGDVKVTREYAGMRKTWVISPFETDTLVRAIVQGGVSNIEKIADGQSEEHLGGRAWVNAQAHLVLDDLSLQFGVGGAYSKDGLASVYYEPAFTYDSHYWGLRGNHSIGIAPSEELSDGDVTQTDLGVYFKPIEVAGKEDEIPANLRLGVKWRQFVLDHPEEWRYSSEGLRAFFEIYFEFGARYKVDPTTGWAKRKSIWTLYAQSSWGPKHDVELHDYASGHTAKLEQDLGDGSVGLSYKW